MKKKILVSCLVIAVLVAAAVLVWYFTRNTDHIYANAYLV